MLSPETASHKRTVRSPLPEAINFPSGENLTAHTGPVWPARTRDSVLVTALSRKSNSWRVRALYHRYAPAKRSTPPPVTANKRFRVATTVTGRNTSNFRGMFRKSRSCTTEKSWQPLDFCLVEQRLLILRFPALLPRAIARLRPQMLHRANADTDIQKARPLRGNTALRRRGPVELTRSP